MRNATLAAVLCLALPSLAAAERTLVVRTQEDPSTFDPSACAGAPFTPNLVLGAEVYSIETRRRTGEVTDDTRRHVGVASACGQITDLAFPAGSLHPFMIRFSLEDGDYTAVGACQIVSNDVPTRGLVLTGCSLRITSAPAGVAGGSMVSSSVFNPARLAGFATGSYWTIHLYEDPAAEPECAEHGRRHRHGHDD